MHARKIKLQMQFVLVITCIQELQIVTTRNSSSSLQHTLSLLSLMRLYQSLPADRSQQCPLLPYLRSCSWDWVRSVRQPLFGYCTSPGWVWSSRRDENWQGKQKYSVLSTQCRFVHHKSRMTCPGLKPRPPRWEASNWPPEVWQGLKCDDCPTGQVRSGLHYD
jgi:hypothetical protein